MQVISSNTMAGDNSLWLTEKSSLILRSLARFLHVVRNEPALSERIHESIDLDIEHAVECAVRLLAYSAGARLDLADWLIVAHGGEAGVDELMEKYGLRSPTPVPHAEHSIPAAFITRMQELIGRTRAGGRQPVLELLQACTITHPVIDILRDLIEEVTVGNLAWETFTTVATEHLAELKA